MKAVSIRAACAVVPRISKSCWEASNAVARWLIASRAPVLVMTVASAAIGGLLAALSGPFDAAAWSLCAIGLVLAHAANNQLNDLTDAVRGVDRGNSFRRQYGVHVLEDGLVSRAALWRSIGFTAAAALAIGLYLVVRVDASILIPLAAGAFFLVAYTHPLKTWALGELAVLLVWGPLMVGGSHLAASGTITAPVLWIGTVYALAPTAVIFGKHIDKADFDAVKGIGTLPVRIGAARARRVVVAMLLLQYIAIVALVLAGWLPWMALLVLLALPPAIRLIDACRRGAPAAAPAHYPAGVWPLWYSAFAFAYARAFGLWLLTGLALALGLQSWQ